MDSTMAPTPPPSPVPSGPGCQPAQPVTADNHAAMTRMGPRQPLTLVGALCRWWPILEMTASSSLGTAAY